jgi:AraC-like DNA-binding protein
MTPYQDGLPTAVYFRNTPMPADAWFPLHSHPWGEFVHVFAGVLELKLKEASFLAPSAYGMWLPPGVEHQGLNRHELSSCSVYIDPSLTHLMPATPCMLSLSPLLRALLEHLRDHPPSTTPSAESQRLLAVVLDQLQQASCAGSYLPASEDPLLQPILRAMETDPSDRRALSEWARMVGTSERTLARHAQQKLGLSLADWRQRLRVVRALALLERGLSIQEIAQTLGYGSPSAFIAMFRREIGQSPDEYRKGSLTLP